MTNVLMFNMCMVVDKERNEVLVLDKIDSQWGGITFPGGHIENGESIVDSAVREVSETEEGKVFWINKNDIHNQNLASGMKTYLKLFIGNQYNEAYAVWNDKSVGEFQLF